MNGANGVGAYATVWNDALENVTLSPAAITSREGRNWFTAPYTCRSAGSCGGPFSPRYTVYRDAVEVERAGIAAPVRASATAATHASTAYFMGRVPLCPKSFAVYASPAVGRARGSIVGRPDKRRQKRRRGVVG